MPTIKSEVKKIQCYHPSCIREDENRKPVKGFAEDITIREHVYENGFTRTNTTTGEFQEFLH